MGVMGWGTAIAGGAIGLVVGATYDPLGKLLDKLPFANIQVAGFSIIRLLVAFALVIFGWHHISTSEEKFHVGNLLGGIAVGYGAFLAFGAMGIENPFATFVKQ